MKTRKRGTVILQYNGYIDRVVGVCNPLQVGRRYWRTQSSRVLAVGVGMKWSSITNNLLSSSSSLCLSLPLSLSLQGFYSLQTFPLSQSSLSIGVPSCLGTLGSQKERVLGRDMERTVRTSPLYIPRPSRRNTDSHQKRFIFFPSPPHSSVTCHCLKQKFQYLTLSL